MADFLEGTTIGGSIAITEKNIYDYLDDIISDTSIDRLAPKTNSFEEYIEAFNITDLNTLSPSRDIGLYITTGVTTPDANIYGTYEIPGNLKTSTWTNTQSKLDVAKYNLTKSPMADKSLLFIFNNDFDPTINKLTLMCYHIDSGVWYRMNQIKGTDKLSKKWEVDLQVQLHYDNMRKLSNVIDNLFSDKMDKSKNLSDVVNVTEARRNLNIALTDVVGSGLSTLYSSQKLSKDIDDKVNANVIVTNETKANLTKTDGKLADTITDLNNYKVSNDKNILDTKTTLQTNINTKITGGSVVQTTGTSTVNVMSQKTVTDEFKKVNDNLNTVIDTTVVDLQRDIDTKLTEPELINKSVGSDKWMREGAYGLGKNGSLGNVSNTETLTGDRTGFYRIPAGSAKPEGISPSSVDVMLTFGNAEGHFAQIYKGAFDRNLFYRSFVRGEDEWAKIYSNKNTTADKNGVLHVGTSTPINTLNVSDMVDTVVDRDDVTVTSGAVYRGLAEKITGGTVVQGLGTSTVNVMSQKATSDELSLLRSNKMDKAQNLKDLVNVTTARTNLGLGTSAIRDLTSVQGTSTSLVATQKLVADVKTEITDYNNTQLAKKWDIQTTTGTGNIARMSEVTKKADTTYVNAELGKKRDLSNNVFYGAIHVNMQDVPTGDVWNAVRLNGREFITVLHASGTFDMRVRPNSGDGRVLTDIDRTWAFPEKTGTVALTSDIPSLNGYATQSWVTGRGYTTLGTANANSTKLGSELSVSHETTVLGSGLADAFSKVPSNSVTTRSAYKKSKYYAGTQYYEVTIYYRPITRL